MSKKHLAQVSVSGNRLSRKNNKAVVFPFPFHIAVQQPSKPPWSRLLIYDLEPLLMTFNEQRNILHEISKRKAKWIGHILRRNCLLQQVIEGKIKGGTEVTGRRWKRRRKLLDDLQERRGYSHLKVEALDRTMWTARFGRGFRLVVRQTAV
jgi:hypothetical protein